MKDYMIQSGDSFFRLAQQTGCCLQEVVEANPGIDPCQLRVGQKIRIPSTTSAVTTKGGCAGFQGKERCDDVFVEVEGVKFRVTRMGEASIPHEVHLIIPRTEIRKVEHPVNGLIETSIMISNINIVNSPRLQGEGSSVKVENKGNES